MMSLFNPRNPRFWLFAPFIGFILLFLIYFFIWQALTSGMSEGLRDNGVTWEAEEISGFPARLTFDLTAPAWQCEAMDWRNQGLSMTLMPFNNQHAVIDFKGTHYLTYAGRPIELAHESHMISVVADLEGLARLAMDVKKPSLTTRFERRDVTLSANYLDVQMRRQEDSDDRYDLALETKRLFINQGKEIGRLSGLVDFDLDLLTEADMKDLAGEKITIQKLNLVRGELTLAARGNLLLGKDGHLQGKLDLNFVNLRALVDALEEFGLSERRDRRNLLLLGGLATAFGGNTQDRIDLPLTFRKRTTYLGKIKLGPSPRWLP